MKLIESFYEFRGDLVLKRFTDGLSVDGAVLLRLCNILSERHDFCNGGWRLFMPTYKRNILKNNIELCRQWDVLSDEAWFTTEAIIWDDTPTFYSPRVSFE